MSAGGDLYALLGVPRDAPIAKIRAAYRKLAKTAHPDVGGDAGAFRRLSLAHDILTDSERRARYDSTGDAAEAAPDNGEAEALKFVAMALDGVLAGVAKMGRPAAEMPLAAMVGNALDELKGQIKAKRRELETAVATHERLYGRFKSAGPENYLEAMINHRVATLRARQAMIGRELEMVDRAIQIVAGYDFEMAGQASFWGSGAAMTISLSG